MHLHIVTGRIDGVQYVNSNDKNKNGDFELRFDGKYGSEILKYVKKFWQNKIKEDKNLSDYTLKKILIEWCDENLTNNRSYGSKNTYNNKSYGKLVYKDGTACSASHAFSEVYKLNDGTYEVFTDINVANFTGDAIGTNETINKKCENIMEVMDHLYEFSFHDLNSVGLLLKFLINNYSLKLDEKMIKNKIPILSKCDQNDKELIKAIHSEMSQWKKFCWNKK